jgi:sugar lactone lactonase YvrE
MPTYPRNAADVQFALDARDQLGESPCWDDDAGELLRVDITGRAVHAWAPADGSTWTIALDGDVSAVVPRVRGGQLLAVDHALVLRDPDGARRTIATVEEQVDENRFNDCRCDPQGRLWAGTMSRTRTPGTAALYRLEPGGELERVVDATTISNGLGWSPAGDELYFVDSTTQRIDAFDFDPAGGAIANRRTLATIDPADGLPDGIAVDADGGIWVCLFGGAAIRRYGRNGELDVHIPLPVTNPTCPAFGGPDLTTLYVTSARHRLTPEQLAAEPRAGALLALNPGVRGQPANRFGG